MIITVPIEDILTSFKNVYIEYPQLVRTLRNISEGRFSNFTLTKEIKETLKKCRIYVKEVTEIGLIKTDREVEILSIIDNALSQRKITQKEYKSILNVLNLFFEINDKNRIKNFEKVVNSLLNCFSLKYKKNIEKKSENIMDEIIKFQERDTKNIFRDFVYEEKNVRYLSEIFQILSMRWNHGFSRGNIQRIVNELTKEGYIRTHGGWKTGMGKRICYPTLENTSVREMRNLKEQIIQGEIIEDISTFFEPVRASHLGVNVYDLSDFKDKFNLYLIAKCVLPKKKDIWTWGIFIHGNLGSCMWERFGYRLVNDEEKIKNEDSQIGLLIKVDQKTVYVDKKNPRVEELFGLSHETNERHEPQL